MISIPRIKIPPIISLGLLLFALIAVIFFFRYWSGEKDSCETKLEIIASPNPITLGETIYLKSQDTSLINLEWYIGEMNVGNGPALAYFVPEGIGDQFKVVLRSSQDLTCPDTLTIVTQILDIPRIVIDPDKRDFFVGDEVQLRFETIRPAESILWEIGGETFVSDSVYYKFKSEGNLFVSITINGVRGDDIPLQVNPKKDEDINNSFSKITERDFVNSFNKVGRISDREQRTSLFVDSVITLNNGISWKTVVKIANEEPITLLEYFQRKIENPSKPRTLESEHIKINYETSPVQIEIN